MKTASQHFFTWLLNLTTVTRYFVIALLVHIAVLFGLAVIKFMPIPSVFGSGKPTERTTIQAESKLSDSDDPWRKIAGKPLGSGNDTNTPRIGDPTSSLDKHIIPLTQPDATPTGPVIVTEGFREFPRFNGSSIGMTGPNTGAFDIGKGIQVVDAFRDRPGSGNKFGTPGVSYVSQLAAADAERAVVTGLHWLKSKQHPDGYWDGPYDRNGNTALAVLAFLGHGEKPESSEFGETVNKGLLYLIHIVGPDGLVPGYSHRVYSQGAVTLALAEGYGMTRSPAIKEPLERAVNAILAWQNRQGGWRYQFQSTDSDVSTSGWMIMALKSARLAGIEVPEEAFARATGYLWSMYHPNGGFGYDRPAQRPSTTAIGVLCLQYMKRDNDKRITKALDYLKTFNADWQNTSDHGFGLVLYWWYYHSQAMFQAGGAYWRHWRTQLITVTVNNQQTDGHWEYPAQSSFEKNFHETGYVYSTALCCLNLEVFYRYLPMHHELEQHTTARASR